MQRQSDYSFFFGQVQSDYLNPHYGNLCAMASPKGQRLKYVSVPNKKSGGTSAISIAIGIPVISASSQGQLSRTTTINKEAPDWLAFSSLTRQFHIFSLPFSLSHSVFLSLSLISFS